ncbi:putative protein phosphatase 2C 43 [Nymphaea thermarum]|nr:putative protein phosphatase 2C 43 [Nymphaea thermarum]
MWLNGGIMLAFSTRNMFLTFLLRFGNGIARRLIRAAIKVAEKKCGVRYAIMKLLDEGGRLACHNDIAVVVVYIDHEMIGRAFVDTSITGASIRGFIDAETASDFSLLDEVELLK